MTDCNNSYDFLKDIQGVTRNILKSIEQQGLLLYATYDVYLVTELVVGEDRAAGIAGEKITKKAKMEPSPRMELNTKLHQEDGIVQKMGVAKLWNIVASDQEGQNYTRKQLEGASYFLIDGTPYDLVEGSLTRQQNGIFWEAVLKRRYIGNRTAT